MFDHFVGLTLKGSKRTSKPNRKNIRKVYFYDRKKKISRNRKKKKEKKRKSICLSICVTQHNVTIK